MKKVLSVLLVILCVIGHCGCAFNLLTPEQIALRHLQSKYNRDFQVVTSVGRNWDVPYDEVLCQDSAGREATVYISDENGTRVIQDDYYGALIHDDYKRLVSDIADQAFDDYKLFFCFMADFYDDELTHEVPLNEALKQGNEQFFSQTCFVIKETEIPDEKALDEMCDAIKKRDLTMYVTVYTVDDELFECVDERKDINEYLPPYGNARKVLEKTIK